MILRYHQEKFYVSTVNCNYISVLILLSSFEQKGTMVEKLVEEVVKDGQHLTHLIGICEGNL